MMLADWRDLDMCVADALGVQAAVLAFCCACSGHDDVNISSPGQRTGKYSLEVFVAIQ